MVYPTALGGKESQIRQADGTLIEERKVPMRKLTEAACQIITCGAYSPKVMMTKGERVAELVRRLEASQPAASADEALRLVTSVLIEIEDQHSGVPNDPTSPMADERIWPPIAKYHFEIYGRPDLDGYRQKATRRSSVRTEPS